MRVAGRVGIAFGQAASLHAVEKIANVEGRRIAADFFHRSAGELQSAIDPLLAAGLNVVVDHFGRLDAKLGVDDPGFRYLLSLGTSRQVWVKLSAAYRNGKDGQGEATAIATMPLLRAAFGLDRLVWGSDWPHTLFEKTESYWTERQLLDQWLPIPTDRQVVLRDTPSRLFAFNR